MHKQVRHASYHTKYRSHCGIAHIKDLLEPALDQHDSDEKIARFVRSADYVPDTKDIIPAHWDADKPRQMVIAVDEYGGTAGVVPSRTLLSRDCRQGEDEDLIRTTSTDAAL